MFHEQPLESGIAFLSRSRSVQQDMSSNAVSVLQAETPDGRLLSSLGK